MILLLAGCWPYIPGTWQDYDGEEEGDADADSDGDSDADGDSDSDAGGPTRVVGEVSWYTYAGGYWARGGDPDGLAVLWWLGDGDPDRDATHIESDGPGCTRNYSISWIGGLAEDVDSSKVVFDGDPQLSLPWDSDLTGFYDSLTNQPKGTYDLVELDIGDEELSIEGVVSMPSAIDFDFDRFDEDEIPSVSRSEIDHFEWSGGDGDDWVIGHLILKDANDDEIESLYCLVSAADGELDFDLDSLRELDDAALVQLALGNARLIERDLDGLDGTSSMLGVRWEAGAAIVE